MIRLGKPARVDRKDQGVVLFGVSMNYRWPLEFAGVAESVDATDLINLSAPRETADAELLKFGEPCEMAIPSQARPQAGKV